MLGRRSLPLLLLLALPGPTRAEREDAAAEIASAESERSSSMLQTGASSLSRSQTWVEEAPAAEPEAPELPPMDYAFMVAMEQSRVAYEEYEEQRKAGLRAFEHVAEDRALVDAAEDQALEDAAEDQALEDAAEDQALEDAAEDQALEDAAEDQALEDAAEDQALEDAAEDQALEDESGDLDRGQKPGKGESEPEGEPEPEGEGEGEGENIGLGGTTSTDLKDLPFKLPFSADGFEHGPFIVKLPKEDSAAVLYWSISTKGQIKLSVAANSQFVAFGMNLYGPTLPGADVVICGKHNGQIKMADYKGVGYSKVELDGKQDWTHTAGGRQEATQPAAFPSWVCPAKGAGIIPTWPAYKKNGKITYCGTIHATPSMKKTLSPEKMESWCCTKIKKTKRCLEICDKPWQLKGDVIAFKKTSCRNMAFHYRTRIRGNCRKSQAKRFKKKCCNTQAPEPTVAAKAPTPGQLMPITWCQGTRPLKTCHGTNEDFEIEDLTMRFDSYWVWGGADFSQDDPLKGMNLYGFIRRHAVQFSFLDNPPPTDPHQQEVEVVAPTVTVPNGGSTVCSYHKLGIKDIEATKYHIIEFSASQSGPAKAEGLQHHVSLFACSEPLGFADGATVACGKTMGKCGTSLLNIGRAGRPLSSDVGKPIGGQGGITHVVLLRHFYNTDNKQNVLDIGTKWIIKYTDKLRPNDEVELMMGRSDFKAPANKLTTIGATCPYGCRAGGTVTVTGVAFHMHDAGQHIKLRAFDQTQELAPVAFMDPWVRGPGTVTVKRQLTDQTDLKLECTFKANYPIKSGESKSEEMCTVTLTILIPSGGHFPPMGKCFQGSKAVRDKTTWCGKKVKADVSTRKQFVFDASKCRQPPPPAKTPPLNDPCTPYCGDPKSFQCRTCRTLPPGKKADPCEDYCKNPQDLECEVCNILYKSR